MTWKSYRTGITMVTTVLSTLQLLMNLLRLPFASGILWSLITCPLSPSPGGKDSIKLNLCRILFLILNSELLLYFTKKNVQGKLYSEKNPIKSYRSDNIDMKSALFNPEVYLNETHSSVDDIIRGLLGMCFQQKLFCKFAFSR